MVRSHAPSRHTLTVLSSEPVTTRPSGAAATLITVLCVPSDCHNLAGERPHLVRVAHGDADHLARRRRARDVVRERHADHDVLHHVRRQVREQEGTRVERCCLGHPDRLLASRLVATRCARGPARSHWRRRPGRRAGGGLGPPRSPAAAGACASHFFAARWAFWRAAHKVRRRQLLVRRRLHRRARAARRARRRRRCCGAARRAAAGGGGERRSAAPPAAGSSRWRRTCSACRELAKDVVLRSRRRRSLRVLLRRRVGPMAGGGLFARRGGAARFLDDHSPLLLRSRRWRPTSTRGFHQQMVAAAAPANRCCAPRRHVFYDDLSAGGRRRRHAAPARLQPRPVRCGVARPTRAASPDAATLAQKRREHLGYADTARPGAGWPPRPGAPRRRGDGIRGRCRRGGRRSRPCPTPCTPRRCAEDDALSSRPSTTSGTSRRRAARRCASGRLLALLEGVRARARRPTRGRAPPPHYARLLLTPSRGRGRGDARLRSLQTLRAKPLASLGRAPRRAPRAAPGLNLLLRSEARTQQNALVRSVATRRNATRRTRRSRPLAAAARLRAAGGVESRPNAAALVGGAGRAVPVRFRPPPCRARNARHVGRERRRRRVGCRALVRLARLSASRRRGRSPRSPPCCCRGPADSIWLDA